MREPNQTTIQELDNLAGWLGVYGLDYTRPEVRQALYRLLCTIADTESNLVVIRFWQPKWFQGIGKETQAEYMENRRRWGDL